MTDDEFFLARTAPQPNGCTLWTGARGKYGIVCRGRGGRSLYDAAHRFSYARTNGPIPAGLSVLHKCDNPLCVNPEHLFVGTQRENMNDMASKGRAKPPCGERAWASKLDAAAVQVIRASSLPAKELAKTYGVSATSVYAVKSRTSWKHLS